MCNPVVHFAIYYDDTDRARAFYETVFGWSFEARGRPGTSRSAPEAPTAPVPARARSGRGRAAETLTIPGVASIAEFTDPEGNLACIADYPQGLP
ncbi:MAG: VOC family protein [Myxococcota bacterium]